MLNCEYKARVELIWCGSLQEKIGFYLDACDELGKTQRLEILASLLTRYLSENDIENELRNLPRGSVENA